MSSAYWGFNVTMPIADVREHRGSPTLFLDNVPTYASVFWCPPPDAEGWRHAEHARAMAEAGVHIYTFGFNWPQPDEQGHYDTEAVRASFRQALEVDPNALFLPRFQLEAPPWWIERNPGELETFADGGTEAQSYASAKWLTDAGDFLRAMIRTTRSMEFGDRFIGYHVCAGHTAEWLKPGARDNRSSDYSPHMRSRFRQWLRQRYDNNENALRRAWRNPNVTFATAEVPGHDIQDRADLFVFRDPARTRQDIDYFACICDVVVDDIASLCRLVKDETNREALAGVFYGYVMELWWSNGFFGRHPRNTHTSYHRIGHLAFQRLLGLADVDFLASPYSYGMRGLGGTNGFMIPSESARLHGKLYFSEDDTRTHLATSHGVARFGSPGSPVSVDGEADVIDGYDIHDSRRTLTVLGNVSGYDLHEAHRDTDYGALNSIDEDIAVLKRNFSNVLTRHVGIWWGYPSAETSGTLADERLHALVKRMAHLGRASLESNRAPSAEIAVIVDEPTWFHLSTGNELAVPLMQRQYLWNLPRIGAPYDLYLASDLAAGRVRDYTCYIFMNQFYADAKTRAGIKQQVERDGKTSVWIYGAGYIGDTLAAENCRELTGFDLTCHHTEWGLNVIVTNFDHPITASLPSNTTTGTDSRIGPIFTCEDPAATPLGVLHFTRGRWRTGFAVKEFPEHKAVWVGAPNLPSHVLRGIARYAGVHIYSDSDDVLSADPQFVGLYTHKREEKTIRLPAPADVIDAFSGELIDRQVSSFTVPFDGGETRLFYYGDRDAFAKQMAETA